MWCWLCGRVIFVVCCDISVCGLGLVLVGFCGCCCRYGCVGSVIGCSGGGCV